jgi:serine/threonine protein kinase
MGDQRRPIDVALDATETMPAGKSETWSLLRDLAHAPEVLPGLTPGVRLHGKRYTVVRPIGRGGMGEVYLAIDEVLGKEVALKLVDERHAGDLERLRDEVLRAHEVTHRNVCRTYDLEEVDGRWLIKMEYIDGQTLADKVTAAQRLSVAETRAIAHQIAQGLIAAHDRGVVHRDLKPQNILIERDSQRVVLTDFGIARLSGLAGQSAGGIAGTPAYMAPEQARGREVDGRADLYALGCVIYYMLTGQAVFPASSPMAAALRHVEDPPPDPRAARPDIPARLSQLVLGLLEKDPARRPASAAEVAAELGVPHRRSNVRMAVALGALATVTLVALLSIRPWSPVPQRPSVLAPRVLFEEADLQGSSVEDISSDGRFLVFAARGEMWVSPRDGVGRVPLRVPLSTSRIDAASFVPGDPQRVFAQLRSERDGIGIWELTRDAPAVPRGSGMTQPLDVRADGTILGLVGDEGQEQLVLLDRTSIHPRPLRSVPVVWDARFSPDGGRVAYLQVQGPQGRVAVIDLASGEVTALDAGMLLSSLAWLDDQTLLATAPGTVPRTDGTMTDASGTDLLEVAVADDDLRVSRTLRIQQRGAVQIRRVTPQGALLSTDLGDGRLAVVATDGSQATTPGTIAPKDHQVESVIGYTRKGIVYQATRGGDPFTAIQRSDGGIEFLESARDLGAPWYVLGDDIIFIRRSSDAQSLVRLTTSGPIALGTIGATSVVLCAGERQEPCTLGERRGELWHIRELSAKTGARGRDLAEVPVDQIVMRPALSLDGRSLAHTTDPGTVAIFDFKTGVTRSEVWPSSTDGGRDLYFLTWETASSWIATECCSPATVVRLTLGGARTVLATSDTFLYASPPRLSPDGRTVAVLARTVSRTYIWIPELRAPN